MHMQIQTSVMHHIIMSDCTSFTQHSLTQPCQWWIAGTQKKKWTYSSHQISHSREAERQVQQVILQCVPDQEELGQNKHGERERERERRGSLRSSDQHVEEVMCVVLTALCLSLCCRSRCLRPNSPEWTTPGAVKDEARSVSRSLGEAGPHSHTAHHTRRRGGTLRLVELLRVPFHITDGWVRVYSFSGDWIFF